MTDESTIDLQKMMIEIDVLNEELREAEELTDNLRAEIEHLTERSRMLENRLSSYGIGFEDIDMTLDAE